MVILPIPYRRIPSPLIHVLRGDGDQIAKIGHLLHFICGGGSGRSGNKFNVSKTVQ
jgi:hypothetical protein